VSNYLWPAAPKAAPAMALSVAALSASGMKGRERIITKRKFEKEMVGRGEERYKRGGRYRREEREREGMR
jgi:hypothetical protein